MTPHTPLRFTQDDTPHTASFDWQQVFFELYWAQGLLAAYLFAVYPIMRVEASTDIENIPEQRALEKAGFRRDGVMRKAQWRGGDWHDIVVYSKLRGE